MDTLALLCNLHADGPATLQRLRRAGCESLASLRRMDPLRLAERLEWNERQAERFLREAALLSGRVEPEAEDAEVLARPAFELESELIEELDGERAELEDEAPEDEVEEALEEESAPMEPPPEERVQVVLGAWRELDRLAPPGEPGAYELPRPAPAPDLALAAASALGLSAHLRHRLEELSVRTLRQLAEASPLALARGIPLGFTRVRHLQYLAGCELARLPEEARPAVSAPAFEAFTPPPSEPFETAGPFA